MQKLKYLFAVKYKDGSAFLQNAEDVSGKDPLRSAFFDVKLPEVAEFTLLLDTSNGENPVTYTVSLADGHFEKDGSPFLMHDGIVTDFQLIFFRRHKHHLNRPIKDGKFVGDAKETGHDISYHFGWWGLDENGKRVQRVMVLN